MQISYLIPSLYSLVRERDSNNSTSRWFHKSLKIPCNSDAISGIQRIMQRLIISSAFRSRCTAIAFYLPSFWLTFLETATVLCFFCTLQRTVTSFLFTLGPFVSNDMQYLGRNQTHFQHHSLTVPNLVHHMQTLPVLASPAAISIKSTEKSPQHWQVWGMSQAFSNPLCQKPISQQFLAISIRNSERSPHKGGAAPSSEHVNFFGLIFPKLCHGKKAAGRVSQQSP